MTYGFNYGFKVGIGGDSSHFSHVWLDSSAVKWVDENGETWIDV